MDTKNTTSSSSSSGSGGGGVPAAAPPSSSSTSHQGGKPTDVGLRNGTNSTASLQANQPSPPHHHKLTGSNARSSSDERSCPQKGGRHSMEDMTLPGSGGASGGGSACLSSDGALGVGGGGGNGGLPSSKDAWSCLRRKMCLEEMLYETSQRAKVYNRNHYGLLGILKVIRMTDPDLNVLALGTDLTSLGLNLNSTECLFSSFGSPWSDCPAARDVESLLPSCYLPPIPPAFKLSHLEKFNEHTLFYMFYCCPRFLLQGCAAAELYNRHWQYHKTWKKWFLCEDPYNRRLPASSQQGGTAGHPGTSSASDGVSGGAGDTSTGGGGGWGSGSSLQRSSTGSSTANSSSSGGGRGAGSDKREHTTTTTPVNGEVEPARNIAGGENTADSDLPKWTFFEPSAWERREFRGVLNTQFFLKADEVRQSVEEGVKQVRAQQQLQQQQLQQLQQQHQQQVSVQHQVSQQQVQQQAVPQNAPKIQHAQQPPHHIGLSSSGHSNHPNPSAGTTGVGVNAWMDQHGSSGGGGAGIAGGR